MREENRDPYDIKKFEEVLSESHMMIPDSIRRLDDAVGDLSSYLQSPEIADCKTGEWYSTAVELVSVHKGVVEKEEVHQTSIDNLGDGEAF